MTDAEEKLIRQWMAYIGETDRDLIDEYIHACNTDAATLRYYLMRAQELPHAPKQEQSKSGGRPGYKFLPPFAVDKAKQETRDRAMQAIKNGEVLHDD